MRKIEKELIFRGEIYSSYYQLEKVMNINRKTIKYRHEKLGIPLDGVPDYVTIPLQERWNGKRLEFTRTKEKQKEMNELDYKNIIEYPEAPQIYFSSIHPQKINDSIAKYKNWLINAPETLVLREKNIYQVKLNNLKERENEKFFFASTYHEEEKKKAENALQTINIVLKERDNNL